MDDSKKRNKMICPRCTGNGYVKIPNKAVGNPTEIVAQCTMCRSEGEIDEVDGYDYSGINHDKLQ